MMVMADSARAPVHSRAEARPYAVYLSSMVSGTR